MASLVSQTDAIRQLRLNEAALSADDIADVMSKAEQASAIIADYCKRQFIEGPVTVNPQSPAPPAEPAQRWTDMVPPDFYPGWWGPEPIVPVVPPDPPPPWTQATVPALVKAAILIVLTSLYDGRTPDDSLLSPQIIAILERQRDPAMT